MGFITFKATARLSFCHFSKSFLIKKQCKRLQWNLKDVCAYWVKSINGTKEMSPPKTRKDIRWSYMLIGK